MFVLYVDEKYRYKGIGRQLLNAFTVEQKEKGVTEQWVSVQDGNQRGIPFYQARGFSLKKKQELLTDTGEKFISLQYARKI
ncbi:GNAT family N-acetyltransferase [Amphibacillus sp. Q70]|uniref:GNAT family N-acetyltransferase n=1 Tax=Amphibacillus sp. Q70 TaxID=3453416 RepID=UPI003F86554E